MNRRGFLRATAATAVAGAVGQLLLPKKIEEIKPKHLTQTTDPSDTGEVLFVIGRNEIVFAKVIKIHENGSLDLRAEIPRPNSSYDSDRGTEDYVNATFLRVRRAVPSDLQKWGNMPGTWFLPNGLREMRKQEEIERRKSIAKTFSKRRV